MTMSFASGPILFLNSILASTPPPSSPLSSIPPAIGRSILLFSILSSIPNSRSHSAPDRFGSVQIEILILSLNPTESLSPILVHFGSDDFFE